jgi:hypothetical protein
MKPIDKNELYENLQGFLKAKGVLLEKGSYSNGIQKACSFLADAINLGQRGVGRAKVEIDTKLDQVRRVIHEKTAPKPPAATAAPPPPFTSASGARPKPGRKSTPPSRPAKSNKRKR